MSRAIYYDTETTGTRPNEDRIIEIAAYDPESKREFVQLINPGVPIPKEATAIHKISDDMVKEAPIFQIVGEAFKEFCGPDAVLIAHNNDAFDLPFLSAEFTRHSLTMHSWKYLDTLKWARKYRSDLPRHSLQFLREIYGIPANQAHRALDDVLVLHKVFSFMIDDIPIEKALALLAEKKAVSRMPFGKHQGKPLSEVPKDYLTWLRSSGALEKPENKELLAALLDLSLLPA